MQEIAKNESKEGGLNYGRDEMPSNWENWKSRIWRWDIKQGLVAKSAEFKDAASELYVKQSDGS